MKHTREFDVIVYGATGFTGQQCAHYFAGQVDRKVRWAMAGRNPEKLARIRAQLGEEWSDVALIIADAQDERALHDLASRTQVVLTTAGPFARYGEKLVAACVDAETDYVDITGETPWVRHLIDTYHEQAEAKGVRIIPCCGVDSIPSDLSVCNLAQMSEALLGEGLSHVEGLFQFKGGLNGGTLASMLEIQQTGQMEALMEPYLLNPTRTGPQPAPRDQRGLRWNSHWWTWTVPFFMAPANTRVVRRSEALYRAADQPYGPEAFSYTEALAVNEIMPLKSLALTGSQWLGEKLMRVRSVQDFLSQRGPKPGEGPSTQTMDQGFLNVWFHGTTESGQNVNARFCAQGDPGNRVTVKMLCEAALFLVEQREDLPESFPGGVLTPASGLGTAFVDRLQDVGIEMEIQLGDLHFCEDDCDCEQD